MIRLLRHQLPPELQQLVHQRTQSLLEHLRQGQEPPESLRSAYRDPRVKAILRAETRDKCAYCESKITHVYFGDVEHIVPKSVCPELTFEHANLALVCAMCNNSKGAFFDAHLPLLNPYVDEPQEFVYATGTLILHRPGNERGYLTCQKLQLNRAPLLERRHEYLEDLRRLVDSALAAPGVLREILLDEVSKRIGPDNEYSLVGKSFVATRLQHAAEPRPEANQSPQQVVALLISSAAQQPAAPDGAPGLAPLGRAPRG